MYEADSKGAIQYMELAREILQADDETEISQEDKIINLEDNE